MKKFSQLGTLVGEHFKQGKSAVLNSTYGGLFNPSWAEIYSVNGVSQLLPNGVSLKVNALGDNTRLVLLIPSKLFSVGDKYRLSYSSDHQISRLTVGEANNYGDTASYKEYYDVLAINLDNSEEFTVTKITKPYICIFMYVNNPPIGTTVNVTQINITKV
jgi:hypothetical protein